MTDTPTTALSNTDYAPDPMAITSGASPTDLDPSVRYYEATTGGTGGVEVINLPRLLGTIGGFADAKHLTQRVNITLKKQTNPSDRIQIKEGGFSTIGAYPFFGLPWGFGFPNLLNFFLDFEGATVSFIWCVNSWQLDLSGTNGNYTVDGDVPLVIAGSILSLQEVATSDPSIADRIWSDGGLLVQTGSSFSGRMIAYFASLPTADPHDAGKPWMNSGVLTVSAG